MVNGFIKPYITQRDKPARCGQGPLPSGSTVYLIQYPSGKFYNFCYKYQQTALNVMSRLNGDEKPYNITSDPDNTLYSELEIK